MDLAVYGLPAVKALGPLFKLTEVYLWDDGSSGGQESHHFQEPTKHCNGYKDYEKRDYMSSNGFSSLPEDLELVKELNDCGLPLSFHTNKERRYGMTHSRRKGRRNYYQQSQFESSLSIEQGGVSVSSISCTTSLSNEHDYNGEVSDHRSDHGSDCSSGLGNNILDDAESAPCKNEMLMTTALCQNGGTLEGSCLINQGVDCDGNEINGELDSVHVEALLDLHAEGQAYDMINDHQTAASGEWIAYWDDFYMRTYFYNVKTEESTWDAPSGMEHLEYGNFADGPESIVDGLAKLDNDQMNFRKPDEVQACDLQSRLYLAEESGYDKKSLSQQLGEITTNGQSGDNISRTDSANRKKKVRRAKSIRKLSISTDDGVLEEATPIISKYWCQKYLLFSRFDCGIKMDEEGWFSVTPEAIAKHQAARCGDGVIIDLFTGTGGNAIQFAQRSKHVIAIDIDPNKIDYARHNAAIYEVHDTIDFISGDSFALAPTLRADTVFMSPPWGGPDYSKVKKFDINTMLKPRDGQTLFNIGMEIAPQIVMFLPRNVDENQLAELALSTTPPWSLEVEKNFLNGRLKAITAYFSQPSKT